MQPYTDNTEEDMNDTHFNPDTYDFNPDSNIGVYTTTPPASVNNTEVEDGAMTVNNTITYKNEVADGDSPQGHSTTSTNKNVPVSSNAVYMNNDTNTMTQNLSVDVKEDPVVLDQGPMAGAASAAPGPEDGASEVICFLLFLALFFVGLYALVHVVFDHWISFSTFVPTTIREVTP